MADDIIFSQESEVTDKEIEELRSLVGWDNSTGPYSVILEILYTGQL